MASKPPTGPTRSTPTTGGVAGPKRTEVRSGTAFRIRSEWLITVGTIAAAIAAALSAYAAFRQEDATYESQLYNKQVDTISTLIQVSEDTNHRISDIFQAFHPLSGEDPGQQDEQRLKQQSVEVFSRFSLAMRSVKLVVPAEIGVALNSLAGGEVSFMQAALDPHHVQDPKKEVLLHVAEVESQVAKVQICASNELSLGRSLRSEEFTACVSK